jgi:hypothetical protein
MTNAIRKNGEVAEKYDNYLDVHLRGSARGRGYRIRLAAFRSKPPSPRWPADFYGDLRGRSNKGRARASFDKVGNRHGRSILRSQCATCRRDGALEPAQWILRRCNLHAFRLKTTFNALRNSGAGPGDLVVIHGVGGLGHLGIQFSARLGFRTIAVNRGREKETLARSLGAHDYIDSDDGDVAEALQARGGAKAIIATVSNADAMKAIVGGLGPNGTLMVIGAVGAFDIDTFALLMKRAAVKGWYSGVAADSEDTLAFSKLHGINSTNEIFPFEKAQAAYDRMISGNARFRVVLKMN